MGVSPNDAITPGQQPKSGLAHGRDASHGRGFLIVRPSCRHFVREVISDSENTDFRQPASCPRNCSRAACSNPSRSDINVRKDNTAGYFDGRTTRPAPNSDRRSVVDPVRGYKAVQSCLNAGGMYREPNIVAETRSCPGLSGQAEETAVCVCMFWQYPSIGHLRGPSLRWRSQRMPFTSVCGGATNSRWPRPARP